MNLFHLCCGKSLDLFSNHHQILYHNLTLFEIEICIIVILALSMAFSQSCSLILKLY